MSVNKLGIILFSSFLILAMTPVAPAQSTYQDPAKKQTTTQKGMEAKDAGKTTPDAHSMHQGINEGKKTNNVSRDKVRQSQAALKRAGFDPGPIDGVMGPLTMTAIRNYQSHNGLQVTGTLDAETENALIVAVSTSRLEREKPAEAAPVSNLEDVRQVQQALKDMEYNPGQANGMMTSQTQQAIREFQWLNSLPVTGNLDEQTRIAIIGTGGYDTDLLSKAPTSNVERAKPAEQTETRPGRGPSAEETPQQDRSDRDVKGQDRGSARIDSEGAERARKAAEILHELAGAPDKRIPNELLERAEAIAVIPNMIKGAFGIGGRFGKGVVSQRLDNGRWSPPSFIQIGGGSFGAQLGVSSTDVVLVFTDRKALDLLEEGKDLKLGVDAAAVAGPVGRSAEAGVNLKLETAIYSYSRSKGLFVGVALDGAVLDIDNSRNEKVYGSAVSAKDVLNGRGPDNPTGKAFMDALEKIVPKKKMSQK